MLGGHQLLDEPLYEGLRNEWVHEEIDLSEYAGQVIQIRFQLRSNGNNRRDGFYFDDLRVYFESTGSLDELGSDMLIYPNPTSNLLYIKLNEKGPINFSLVDMTGKKIIEEDLYASSTFFTLPLEHIEAGIYLLNIYQESRLVGTKRVTILR